MRTRKRYRGDLLKPIAPLNFEGGERSTAFAERMILEIFSKFNLLSEHYGIARDEAKWFWLAYRLATDHVPGFRVAGRPGRPLSSGKLVEDMLLSVELAKVEQSGKSVNNAVRHLVNRPGRFKGRNAENLRQRYYKLKGRSPENRRLRQFIDRLQK